MKRYALFAILFCFVAAISVIFFTTIIPKLTDDNDVINLENSIIVNGIQMESDIPMIENSDEIDGQIIFDDSFDDSMAGQETGKKPKDLPIKVTTNLKEFERLRAKDSRWHLRRYKIKKMDNLWKIARQCGVDHGLIIGINGITRPDMLKPGKLINVPSKKGVSYQIKKGDTILRIAARYRIRGSIIVSHNRIHDGRIRPGQKIFLPDAREPENRKAPEIASTKSKREPSTVIADLRNFIWPMRGKITSGFGNRRDPLSGQRSFHCGIDISANPGTPVLAASDGKVIFSGWKPGYGNVVILRHKNGYISVYAHNSKNIAEIDSTVSKGETIAYSGMTGAVTGAHLHFELRKYVTPLNPIRFLR